MESFLIQTSFHEKFLEIYIILGKKTTTKKKATKQPRSMQSNLRKNLTVIFHTAEQEVVAIQFYCLFFGRI